MASPSRRQRSLRQTAVPGWHWYPTVNRALPLTLTLKADAAAPATKADKLKALEGGQE